MTTLVFLRLLQVVAPEYIRGGYLPLRAEPGDGPAARYRPLPMAVSDGGLLRIGEVAERVGLSLRTIRYYEEVGLLTPASRSGGGFRLYSEEDVRRLTVLKGVKPLGLSLEEARRLMKVLDRTEDQEALADDDLARAVTELETISAVADARLAAREQQLEEARRLQRRVAARLEECRGALARERTPSS